MHTHREWESCVYVRHICTFPQFARIHSAKWCVCRSLWWWTILFFFVVAAHSHNDDILMCRKIVRKSFFFLSSSSSSSSLSFHIQCHLIIPLFTSFDPFPLLCFFSSSHPIHPRQHTDQIAHKKWEREYKTMLRPIIKLWLMCNFNYYINHHNCNTNATIFCVALVCALYVVSVGVCQRLRLHFFSLVRSAFCWYVLFFCSMFWGGWEQRESKKKNWTNKR